MSMRQCICPGEIIKSGESIFSVDSFRAKKEQGRTPKRTALNLYEQAKLSDRLINARRAERCVKDHATNFGRVAIRASRFHEGVAGLHVFIERRRTCGD